MSDDTDRIPVPTNGTGPHPVVAVPQGRVGATPVGDVPGDAVDAGAVPRDQTVAFTPNQLAAGFGIVAGLLLLFAARRRRGRE
jgi:hypothetical protein